MRLSKQTEYGIRAVIQLCKLDQQTYIQSRDLAAQERLPAKFLEAILLELRKGGLLNSKKGKGGGYVLAKDPHDISVGDIIRTLEGSFSELNIQEETKEINEIRMVMKEVRDAMSARYVAAYERVSGRSLDDWYGATS